MNQLIPIITKNASQVELNWQKELAQSYTDPAELLHFLGLNTEEFAQHLLARKLFPMRVPKPFANKMRFADPMDPLLNQVIPLSQEFIDHPEFTDDPLLEHQTQGKGLLHKYASRVLLIVRGGCAVNCRYCFRRHFPYQENSNSKSEWLETLEYIAGKSDINEVILSGGDPLMAKDSFLQWLTDELIKNSHIKRIRIHTRLPVVIPNRINQEFIDWFGELPVQKIMVLHINHAREVDAVLASKLAMLKMKNVTLLNQAVLLKGINDSVDTQVNLNEAVFEAGVLPYYLHQLDKVKGATHFSVSDQDALSLMSQVVQRLPGFLVPKLVREIGGQPSKTPIDLKLHP